MKTYEEITEEVITEFKDLGPQQVFGDSADYFTAEKLEEIRNEVDATFGLDFKDLFDTFERPAKRFAELLTLLMLTSDNPGHIMVEVLHSSMIMAAAIGARIQLEKNKDPR